MKSIFTSRTFWVNIVSIAALVGASFGVDLPPEVQTEVVSGLLFLINLANIGLRLVTSKAVYVVKND